MAEFPYRSIERKDLPSGFVIEIGAHENNGYLKQYEGKLPPNTKYQIINVDYDILPNEQKSERTIPLDDNTVDEAIMSNVLSDAPFLDFELDDPETKTRLRKFWESIASQGGIDSRPYDEILDDIAVFQKIRTIDDVLRVLKVGGALRIYENYNHTRPKAFVRILELLQKKSHVDFVEDIEEERRIAPLLKKENDEYLVNRQKFSSKSNPNFLKDYVPRPYNKVYKLIKK